MADTSKGARKVENAKPGSAKKAKASARSAGKARDLDIKPGDAAKVTGGRRRAEDPCAGGE